MPTAAGIFKLVGTGLITGVGTEIAEFGLGQILDAITGGSSSAKKLLKNQAKIQKTLKTIQSSLSVIKSDLNTVQNDIESLAEQLALDVNTILQDQDYAALQASTATIETHFGDSPEVGLQWFVAEFASQPDPSDQLRTAAESFSARVLGSWDIPAQIATIQKVLMDNEGSPGLIQLWANLFIAKMNAARSDSEMADLYQIFQAYLHQYLSTQAKGAALVTNALQIAPGALENANQYYINTFQSMIQQEITQFVGSVESMALSQTTATVAAPSPAFSPVLRATLARVDLFAAELMQSGFNGPAPGLRGRALLPPHLAESGVSPSITPSPGFSPSQGSKPYAAPGSASPKFAGRKLEPATSGLLTVVRYHWDWPSPPPPSGVPLPPGTTGSDIVPEWVNPDSGEPASADDGVLYASFLDITAFDKAYLPAYWPDRVYSLKPERWFVAPVKVEPSGEVSYENERAVSGFTKAVIEIVLSSGLQGPGTLDRTLYLVAAGQLQVFAAFVPAGLELYEFNSDFSPETKVELRSLGAVVHSVKQEFKVPKNLTGASTTIKFGGAFPVVAKDSSASLFEIEVYTDRFPALERDPTIRLKYEFKLEYARFAWGAPDSS